MARQPRQDGDENDNAEQDPAPSNDSAQLSVVPLHKRRLFRSRNMGLDVSAPPATPAPQPPRAAASSDAPQSPKAASLAPIQFAPPTGLVKDDLEKHM